MQLFYSPFHTFVHKVLVTAHECGHWGDLERIATFPFKNLNGEDQGDAYSLAAINRWIKCQRWHWIVVRLCSAVRPSANISTEPARRDACTQSPGQNVGTPSLGWR